MNKHDSDFFAGALIAFVLTVLISIGVSINVLRHSRHGFEREAIEHGAAEYDRVTGEWKWIEPKE